ncbi:hypothetical protein CCY16_00716 [Wolbachia endosymbiont of Wuchereria bancrofti]|nr:hypothetical protein CCY16_00716 [Wolbachia endosymbiont of Wuchereria bancrofti]
MEFLNTHPKKKEIVAEFNNEHYINESDLKNSRGRKRFSR